MATYSVTDSFYGSNGTVTQDTLEKVLKLIENGQLGKDDTKESLKEHLEGIQGGDLIKQEIRFGRVNVNIFKKLYNAIDSHTPSEGGRRKQSRRKTRHGKKRSLRKTNRKHKSRHHKRNTKRHHKRNTKRSNKSRKH